MNNPILTIAIPVYNMEMYLSKCLDSVLLPELEGDVEVIVVNDGSKDKSLTIAKEYESRYPNILKVVDKENGGWGTAINKGIESAKGKYFRTLDSDDWFDSKVLLEYVRQLKDTDADVFATSYNEVDPDGKVTRLHEFPMSVCGKPMDFEKYLIENKPRNLPIHTLTIRTSILQDNNIRVLPKYYADIDYNLIPLLYVKTIQLSQLNLYQYLVGREGQSISLSSYLKNLPNYVQLCEKVLEVWKSNIGKISEVKQTLLFEEAVSVSKSLYKLCMNSGGYNNEMHTLKAYDKKLRQDYRSIYKALNKITSSKKIPYIWLWRVFGINIYKK